MAEFRGLFRFKRTFVSIFVSLLLLSVVLCLLIFYLLTNALLYRFELQRVEAEAANLNMIISRVEFEFRTLHQLMAKTSASSNIFPLTIYGEVGPSLQNTAIIELNRAADSTMRIKASVLCLERQGLVLASDYSSSPLESSPYGEMIRAYQAERAADDRFESNNKITHIFRYDSDLILAQEFPLDGRAHLGILFYYVDMEAIFRSLSDELGHARVCIYDAQGAPLFEDMASYPEDLDPERLGQTVADEALAYGHVGDNIAFYGKSDMMGWQFCYLTDPSQLALSGMDLARLLAPIILSVLGIAVALSYLLSRILYQPIRLLITNIAGEQPTGGEDGMAANEMDYLRTTFTNSSRREKALTSMMQNVGNDVLTRLFIDLFHGKTMDRERVAQILENVHSGFRTEDHYEVFCFRLPDSLAVGTQEYMLFRERVNQELEAFSQRNQTAIHAMQLKEQIVLVMAVGDDGGEAPLRCFAEQERDLKSMLHRLARGVLFGAGSVYHTIFDVRFSYQEASMAVKMQHDAGKSSRGESAEEGDRGRLRLRQITAMVLENKRQDACELAARMLEEIRGENRPPEECFGAMQSWLSGLAAAMAETEYVELRTLSDNKKFRFDKAAIAAGEPDAVYNKALEIGVGMIDELDQRFKRQQNRYIVKAKKYISERYADQNLSQTAVAEAIGTSNSYLSKLFAVNLDVNFSKYLNQFRVRKSCELLKGTNASVKDIAERVGFSSAQSYIRAFRAVMGMTPGQYRSGEEQTRGGENR